MKAQYYRSKVFVMVISVYVLVFNLGINLQLELDMHPVSQCCTLADKEQPVQIHKRFSLMKELSNTMQEMQRAHGEASVSKV